MISSIHRTVNEEIEKLYPPSWGDRLMEKIEGLPGPIWAFYLLAYLLLTVITYIAYWWDGTVEPGTFNFILSTVGIYSVFPIGLNHYLNTVATRSLNTFRPALDVDESEYARLNYRLITLPAKWGWLAVILGIPIAFIEIQTSPGDFLITPFTSVALLIYLIIISSFFAATLLSLLFNSVRQLRLVSAIHRQASKINLFFLTPVHAFSNLSARTSIGLIFLMIFLSQEQETGAVNIGIFLVLIPVSFAAFFLPLVGMYSRIREEKERRIDEMNHHIDVMIEKIQHQVSSDNFEIADDLNKAMASMISGREVLEKISAWPWDPSTFKGFLSTVLLPIILWLLFRILERFL